MISVLLSTNNELGGYFEFDLPDLGQFPYPQAFKYNSARSAFYDLLVQNNIKKIWMPNFICDSMIEPLILLNVSIQYYNIDSNFYPDLPNQIQVDEHVFYVNYFGLCTSVQKKILDKYPANQVIFDHSQAFFIPPFECFATIYSPRKFLPVAEGGLLITKSIKIPDYISSEIEWVLDQYQHIFIRKLSSASNGYDYFKKSENSLNDCIPRKMSKITEEILYSLDYCKLKKIRLENFNYLHCALSDINQLQVDISTLQSPLIYPLLLDRSYSEELIKENIFIPTYWADCLKRASRSSFEYKFINNTTNLVCDHRYSSQEMQFQIYKIKEIYNEC